MATVPTNTPTVNQNKRVFLLNAYTVHVHRHLLYFYSRSLYKFVMSTTLYNSIVSRDSSNRSALSPVYKATTSQLSSSPKECRVQDRTRELCSSGKARSALNMCATSLSLRKFGLNKKKSNNIFSNYLWRSSKEAACLPLPCFQHAWQQLTRTRHLRKKEKSFDKFSSTEVNKN